MIKKERKEERSEKHFKNCVTVEEANNHNRKDNLQTF